MQTKNINQQLLGTTGTVSSLQGMINSPTAEGIPCAGELNRAICFRTEVDGNKEKFTASEGCYKLTPPPYRMPPQPLYNEPASIPGSATPSVQQMHTHSNKFPIEREVILSNYDKNLKIPILNEYHRRQKAAAAAAAAATLDLPTVQVAWMESRSNRPYMDARNIPGAPPQLLDGINIECQHRTYKAHPLLLETTNGTEPSPNVHQPNSNGFLSDHLKTPDISYSTSETEHLSKAFPSRTYHTIKDMISSRFNGKTKVDRVSETSLNNSESIETPKPDNNLSPNNHLVQRGIYLANSQPSDRSAAFSNNGTHVAKRNKEVREQILSQYRERAIDVGQTAIDQQIANANAIITNSSCRPGKVSTTMKLVADCETPNRFRDQAGARFTPRDTIENLPHEVMIVQENGQRLIEHQMHDPMSHTSYQQTSNPLRRIYEHYPSNEKPSPNKNYSIVPRGERMPTREPSSVIQTKKNKAEKRPSDPSLLVGCNAAATVMECCNMARAESNDQLPEPSDERNPNVRKELPLKQKSKSFEILANENDEELAKLEGKSSEPLNGISSDYEKNRCGGQSDSGRGSTVYSSGKLKHSPDAKENQWVDMVENELKHILEPKAIPSNANSTLSDSSACPALPPASPDVSSDDMTAYKHKNKLCSNKGEIQCRMPSVPSSRSKQQWSRPNPKDNAHQRLTVSMQRSENSKLPSTAVSSSLDLDSMFDEENNTSNDEISISDTRAIRKQLEGLENMYSEVIKLLGVKKSALNKYQCSDPRLNKRRLYGSVSSLPSSVSSRPVRDRHRRPEDRKKFVRDIKGINKRFQRLESHVVTLARSVAHLSSEMRTQHLMIQEMEVIRNELTNLRSQTNMLTVRPQSIPRFLNFSQVNPSPDKMKKLTKFFGDEPPLLKFFLKKLGYEKYAPVFEKERIGLAELPYMCEERLQKLGIPMGPRLRIIQEAQLDFPGNHENTLCIV